MRLMLYVILIKALTSTLVVGLDDLTPASRVAVVGAGVGGSSAAYYLQQLLKNNTSIDVYEMEAVGGRTQGLEIDGRLVEMGASIIHEQNKYFRDLAVAMGLKRVSPGAGNKENLFSIYDGSRFVFQESKWKALTLFRLIRRYGLAYFWFRSAPSQLLEKFKGIYSLQSSGRAFQTPDELLREVGLLQLTQQNMRTAIQDVIGSGVGAQRFAKEFIGGINHINYNQDNSINAMAGMVSMLPTVDSRVFQIEGGNFQLPKKLLETAAVNLFLGSKVNAITQIGTEFQLQVEGRGVSTYAAVIVATPLEQSGLELRGFEPPKIPARKFQTTVTTIVRGKLQATYFGVPKVPEGEYIMVAEGAGLPISVVAPFLNYVNGTSLYKVFSPAPMDNKLVRQLFGSASVVASHSWKAYPRFKPPEEFAPFQLTEGLYYNNALENAASAMEIAAIAGKNTAILAASYLQAQQQLSKGRASAENVEL